MDEKTKYGNLFISAAINKDNLSIKIAYTKLHQILGTEDSVHDYITEILDGRFKDKVESESATSNEQGEDVCNVKQ